MRKTAFQNLKESGLSKGCLPQILINTFLNTLSQIVGVLDYSKTKTFQGKIRGKNIFPKKLKVAGIKYRDKS